MLVQTLTTLLFALPPATPRPALSVDNLAADAVVSHDLVIVEGTAPPDVHRVTVRDALGQGRWPVRQGRFTALVQLTPGANVLALAAGEARTRHTLRYVPASQTKRVRLVYVVASDGDGRFMAPEDEPDDVASATARLAFAGRLLQAVTAEKLRERGYGAKVFRLLRDARGDVDVHVARASFTRAEAWAMDGHALYKRVAADLAGLPEREDTVDVVLLAMTRWDARAKRPLAHTALGGGRLALFGSGSLHTWPQGLGELHARLTDGRAIDTDRFFDDSAFRRTRWANFATGLGATLHELGHVFGLPHRDHGFMARGFDHINRSLGVLEPAGDGLRVVTADEETGWHPESARHLAASGFFATPAAARDQ